MKVVECITVENVNNVTIQFSRNMSGVPGTITRIADGRQSIVVRGFNGSFSLVDEVGQNDDGRIEYIVEDILSGMVLLSAHDYAKDRAKIYLVIMELY
jgi:hypothetical protein